MRRIHGFGRRLQSTLYKKRSRRVNEFISKNYKKYPVRLGGNLRNPGNCAAPSDHIALESAAGEQHWFWADHLLSGVPAYRKPRAQVPATRNRIGEQLIMPYIFRLMLSALNAALRSRQYLATSWIRDSSGCRFFLFAQATYFYVVENTSHRPRVSEF